MFKDLDDAIVGHALMFHGRQLFVDDYVIEGLEAGRSFVEYPSRFGSCRKSIVSIRRLPVRQRERYASLQCHNLESLFRQIDRVIDASF